MTFEIQCVESVIQSEIDNGLTQREIAKTYALALRSSWPTDWAKVNRIITDRWGVPGLKRIKKMAHSGKCFEGTGDGA